MAKKVLVVDDEKHVVNVLQTMLARKGYRVSVAADGRGALRKAFKEKPDLVLLDLMIPKIDGTTVAQRLREDPRTADIPVIFLTGLLGEGEARRRGPEIGGHYFLPTPFDAEQLYETIEMALPAN